MAKQDQAFNRRPLEQVAGYSQAVMAGDHLFISGCVSWDMEGQPLHVGDFPSQVQAVYADIDATLKAHGMSAADVVRETIYTSDMIGLASANEKRLEYYRDVTPPASTWVEIRRLVHPDLLLEVEVTAYRRR